jgi:hypothetical protein
LLDAAPSLVTEIAPEGYGAILPATALVFVPCLGFVKITSVAEEIKDPGRNLPRAVLGSVAFVTVVCAIVMIVLLAVPPTDQLPGAGTAVVDAARNLLGETGALALTVGGLLATASSANASILASSRINFAMGRDRIVSDWLNEIHPRHYTPHRSILLTGSSGSWRRPRSCSLSGSSSPGLPEYVAYARDRGTDQSVLAEMVGEEDEEPVPGEERPRPRYVVALSNHEPSRTCSRWRRPSPRPRAARSRPCTWCRSPIRRRSSAPANNSIAWTRMLERPSNRPARTRARSACPWTSTTSSPTGRSRRSTIAREQEAEGLILGYGSRATGLSGRVGDLLGELTRSPPFDVYVMKDRGLEIDRVLVPTAGGANSTLAAVAAKALAWQTDAQIHLLHVIPDEDAVAEGEASLKAWARERGLEDAERIVRANKDAVAAIDEASTERVPDRDRRNRGGHPQPAGPDG